MNCERMAAKHLKNDIESYGYDLISLAENYDNVHDLLQHLSLNGSVHEQHPSI